MNTPTTSGETARTAEGVAGVLADSMEPLEGGERALALATYRLLAEGEPVEPAELAARAAVPGADAERWLEEIPGVFRDEEGRVIGFWGLAIPEMPHRFEVDGVDLHAWCAWDTLFMPPLIGKPASVRSSCPTSAEEIRLTVSPDGVEAVSPADAVVSMLMPEGGFDADVIQSFCHHVHFFASREAGERWIAERDGDDAFLLSVEEAFRLGRLWNEHRFGLGSAA